MGFLDKAKSAAEQAAKKAKETADDVQTKRELGQAYGELGRTAFELIEGGELSNEALTPIAERIRELAAKDDEGEAAASEEPAAVEEEHAAGTPA